MKSKKPQNVTVTLFGIAQQVKVSAIVHLISIYNDTNALLLLNSIPPVERARVYRELGA